MGGGCTFCLCDEQAVCLPKPQSESEEDLEGVRSFCDMPDSYRPVYAGGYGGDGGRNEDPAGLYL